MNTSAGVDCRNASQCVDWRAGVHTAPGANPVSTGEMQGTLRAPRRTRYWQTMLRHLCVPWHEGLLLLQALWGPNQALPSLEGA